MRASNRPTEPLFGLAFTLNDHETAQAWARRHRPLIKRVDVETAHECAEEGLHVYTRCSGDYAAWHLFRHRRGQIVVEQTFPEWVEPLAFATVEGALGFIAAVEGGEEPDDAGMPFRAA